MLAGHEKPKQGIEAPQKMRWTQLLFSLCFLLSVAFVTPASGNQNSDWTPPHYSLPRSALVTDVALTAFLMSVQYLVPLNQDSQRLFSDDVNSLDRSVRDRWHTKSDNFLNGSTGSFYTPLAAGIVLAGLNLAEDAPLAAVGSELFIFVNGGLANKFLTEIFKRAFSRRRPLLEFADPADQALLGEDGSNYEAFYSGHTSTAFYSAAFLRRRISQSLARRRHCGVKSGYQCLTSSTLYSWAAFVGYSRIEIDKHYFTDVAVGAVMGLLFEEAYYRLNQSHWNSQESWRLAPQAMRDCVQITVAKPL